MSVAEAVAPDRLEILLSSTQCSSPWIGKEKREGPEWKCGGEAGTSPEFSTPLWEPGGLGPTLIHADHIMHTICAFHSVAVQNKINKGELTHACSPHKQCTMTCMSEPRDVTRVEYEGHLPQGALPRGMQLSCRPTLKLLKNKEEGPR